MTAAAGAIALLRFDNSYARLPERFFARLAPTPVAAPRLIRINESLAQQLGIAPERLAAPDGVEWLAGNRPAEGSEPIAMAYAGHQFASFVPQLGDGRALLLGEVVGRDGQRRDIQLKGAGPTPFSRRGDGRAALGPVLREYLVSEAMAALGIPTTRALAAVLTGEFVWRERPLPGAVLARVASSHIRIGTFQYFAARGDTDAVRTLADHVIARHYPGIADADNPYLALLDAVASAQARLIARWLSVGFIHGVMNTDNMSIAGETIDYGPCAFMDAYHPDTVFSSIDEAGRYAYGNQPAIAQWNLARLAEALLPLLADTEDKGIAAAQDSLVGFATRFGAAYDEVMAKKLGLPGSGDRALAQELLAAMAEHGADFTLAFRHLAAAAEGDTEAFRALFGGAIDAWLERWQARRAAAPLTPAAMRDANPLYIPRNHLVEEAIAAAVERDDFTVFENLLAVLAEPYAERPGRERYAAPPRPEQIVHRTFCGT